MKIDMKKSGLVFWLVSLSSFVFAQSNYRPVIIINNNGDSLTGQVDYRNWKLNPETIDFINSGNEKRSFDPSSIRSFYLINENVKYTSYHVTIDQIPDDYLKVFSKKITAATSKEKNVFLLQLIKGEPLSLYSYTDKNKSHFYYSKENENPVELIYHFLYVESSGELQTITSYREQLAAIMANSTTVVSKLSRVHYTEKELTGVFLEYLNSGNNDAIIEVNPNKKLSLRFGVVGGIMYNRFKFVGNGHITQDPYSNLAIDNYSSNLSPIIGASLDLGLQRRNNNWHLINELIFKNYKTSNTSFTHTVLYDYTNDINISFSYLQLNTLVRYMLQTKSNIKPFLNIGIGNGYRISENQNSSHLTYDNGVEKTNIAIEGAQKYERSIQFGAGISNKKFQWEGRYSFSNGFSPYVKLLSKVNSTQLIFTYQF